MDRHVALDGCHNMRDLGGFRTRDGRTVRRGCVYRSDELCSLTDADLEVFERLGVRVAFDLRNAWERDARPNRTIPGLEVRVRTSPSTSGGQGETLEEQIVRRSLPARDDVVLTGIYVGLIEGLAREVGQILVAAADAVERPLLFHCAAGKDRTGLVAALLLGVLGVPHRSIVDDYELTTRYYAPRRLDGLAGILAEYGVREDEVRHLVEARTPALEGALAHVHDRWGGYDGYAVDAVGLHPDLPDRLRAALTTTTGATSTRVVGEP